MSPTTESQNSGGQGLFTKDTDLSTLKVAKAAILIRPYPRTIAGTPLSITFTAASDTLRFSYSAKVRGVTDIFVPKSHYPHGYSVALSGAHVISKAGAESLQVKADVQGTVRVTVSPR